ncbi:putative membrane-bound dehydrogenase domain-containing protein [Spirosomataceae bacterium TFI 002]|nr:putative membrane-bound dehydrogenase domain-containing protein [Spirosomataceae bacterium TFI 002]
MKRSIILLCFVALACQKTPNSISSNNTDLSPELLKALSDFEIMDGFKIELVASEPLICDPVAMEIDEDGNFYVAEMPGYPMDLSKTGKIKRLIDTNGDGFPDKSEVFADSLTLPMGIMKWEDGLLVADAPDVLFISDKNKDGKADRKEAMLTGFSLSNPQHNMNTPKFGVDNWIYVAHSGAINSFSYEHVFGDKGSDVRFPNNPKASKLNDNADGRSVRFKPETFEIESLSGESQYGHTTDPWGHRFYTDNANHLFYEAMDARYLDKNRNLVLAEAMEKFSDHGNACEVFPITENPNHQLLTDVGIVTSSCGITWYDGGAFGPNFNNVTFVGEPVHNLVHADVIQPKGASFTGKRLLENKEFLASKDPWFRPVNFYVGPDGALYVIDYYRQIVEHPEWMSEEVNESGALYNGTNKGRIYRITPTSGIAMDWLNKLNLSSKTSSELVDLLSNNNGWYRRTAQRLLFQRKDISVAEKLKQSLQGQNDLAKIPALWLLQDWGKLNAEDLTASLNSKESGIKENALQLIDRNLDFLKNKDLLSKVKILAQDENPKVRHQWLCSSAFFDFEGKEDLQLSIAIKDMNDQWTGMAAIVAFEGKEFELFDAITNAIGTENEQKNDFINHLASTLAKKADSRFLQKCVDGQQENDWWQAAAIGGLADYWKYRKVGFAINEKLKQELFTSFLSSPSHPYRVSVANLFQKIDLPTQGKPAAELRKRFLLSSNVSFKEDALALLSTSRESEIQVFIIDLASKSEIAQDQLAALKVLPSKLSSIELAKISTTFSRMSKASKSEWVSYLTRNKKSLLHLIAEVKKGNISQSDLQWPQIVEMMNNDEEDVRTAAREVFAVNEDRKAILQNYLVAADLKGDAKKGREIFQSNCSICHMMPQITNAVDFGPDLSTLKSRNQNSIITEIINPNNSIADKYAQWEITLQKGELLTGIITAENDQTISLKQMGGHTQTIDKESIKSKTPSKSSAMPDGLEANISVNDMADLVAFIKGN